MRVDGDREVVGRKKKVWPGAQKLCHIHIFFKKTSILIMHFITK